MTKPITTLPPDVSRRIISCAQISNMAHVVHELAVNGTRLLCPVRKSPSSTHLTLNHFAAIDAKATQVNFHPHCESTGAYSA